MATVEAVHGTRPRVRSISLEEPWRWLALGLEDFKAAPVTGLAYGLVFVITSYGLTFGLWSIGLEAWIPALAGGFMILGPLFAVGLYQMSRGREKGRPVNSIAEAFRIKPETALQMAYMGFLLSFLYLTWLRIAMLLYAVFLDGHYYPFSDFVSHMLTTPNGLSMLAVGTVIGAIIAFTVFAVSAISIPVILDKNVDVGTAVLTSLEAVRRNPAPLLLWAWIIAVFMGLGMATAFVGLTLAFPVIGHATWHAYKALVPAEG